MIIELAALLKDQIAFLPVRENDYFLNLKDYTVYSTKMKRNLKNTAVDSDYLWFQLKDGSSKRIKLKRIICYYTNGLREGMISIFDGKYSVSGSYESSTWVNWSEFQLQKNLQLLNSVKERHPELAEKEGFFDEGPISFKDRPGFYFVPRTGATLVLNPATKEMAFSYSSKNLTPDIKDKGYIAYAQNPRLSNSDKTMIFYHRALIYITKPLPEKYKDPTKTLSEIVESLDVDHIDGHPDNNEQDNLQYLTRKENLIKKVTQGNHGRAIRTKWINPEGEEKVFESVALAELTIKPDVKSLHPFITDWRNRKVEFHGWRLIEGRRAHKHEKYYQFFDGVIADRLDLVSTNSSIIVHFLSEDSKKTEVYENLDIYCRKNNLSYGRYENHLYFRGPLEPIDNTVIIPLKYCRSFLFSNYLRDWEVSTERTNG